MSAAVDLSIIIPAYNEAARLPATLDRIAAFCAKRPFRCEVLVVDDGSTDATGKLLRNPPAPGAGSITWKMLRNPGNRGKGFSVRHGMLSATGKRLLFTDADLAAPIEEIIKLEAALDLGAAVAIGSRSRYELIQAHQSRFRESAGRGFNQIVRATLGLRFHDTQCGFKLFTQAAAQLIFPAQRIERWGFDPELLYLALHSGLRVEEVPVVWSHVEGAKIRMVRDSIRMFADVLQIRRNARQGLYDVVQSGDVAAEAEPETADRR